VYALLVITAPSQMLAVILRREINMKFLTIIFLTTLLSCNSKQVTQNSIENTDSIKISNKVDINVDEQNANATPTEIIETFVDSLNIGRKGKCKIELIKHRVYDDIYIIIKFYIKGKITTKDPETWINQNSYSYETNAIMDFEPNLSDFNNDNFNDLTFISETAARGANEVRRLFIYDDKKQELISMVNSQDYPNMLYNKELQCIDAFLVYGGSSTVFLRIKGDSLKEFASVEAFEGITIREFDKNGKEKIIYQDTANKASYIRFKTYKPLKEYDTEY